jgi:nitrate reductase delta subunit
MAHAQGSCEQIARLLRYPDENYPRDLREIPERLEGHSPEAARLLRSFRDQVGDLRLEEIQELFTRTFDLNPVCALEVGWQLYGDEYARGSFLVFMRDALRRHGIPEGGELPDHLIHVLPLLDHVPAIEASEFAGGVVIPALEKMLKAFAKKDSPYENVLRAVQALLEESLALKPAEVSHA